MKKVKAMIGWIDRQKQKKMPIFSPPAAHQTDVLV